MPTEQKCPIKGCRRREEYCWACRTGELLPTTQVGQDNLARNIRKAFANGYVATWLDPPKKNSE